LVSLLEAGQVRYMQNGQEHTVAVKGGFVRVSKDKIEITVETDGNIQ
jgi:F0F1-type ATP synthase epsilon subunit